MAIIGENSSQVKPTDESFDVEKPQEAVESGKKSQISPTLLSNFLLAISLLKNVAQKFVSKDDFIQNFH